MGGLWFDSGIDKGFENDLARMNGKVNAFVSNTQKQTSQLSSMFKQAGGILAGYFGVSQIVSFGKELVNTIAKFEKYNIILENTLGSQEKAARAMEMVKDFAASTPFSVDELTDAFIRLTNQGFQPSKEEMTKMGDLASSTGKQFIQLAEAILDAQTGEFERLKEFGIKAKVNGDKIAFSFKGQTVEVNNTAESIRNYIVSLGELEGVAGANAKIAESLAGKMSNLGDAWDDFMLSLDSGNSVISKTVKLVLDLAGAALKYQALLNEGNIEEIAFNVFGQDENLNKVYEKQKLVLSKLTTEKGKAAYINGELTKTIVNQKKAEWELAKTPTNAPFKKAQLEAEIFIYKKITKDGLKLQLIEADALDSNAGEGGITFDKDGKPVLNEEGKPIKKYGKGAIEAIAYAQSKIADYDTRIGKVSAELLKEGVPVNEALDVVVNTKKARKTATRESLEVINSIDEMIDNMDTTQLVKDDLKTKLSDSIEMTVRRKNYVDDVKGIMDSPEGYEIPDELEDSQTAKIKQLSPELTKAGKPRTISAELEVGKDYYLAEPLSREGNTLTPSPKTSLGVAPELWLNWYTPFEVPTVPILVVFL